MDALQPAKLTRIVQERVADFGEALGNLPDEPSEDALKALAVSWQELFDDYEEALAAYKAIPTGALYDRHQRLIGDARLRADIGVDLNGVNQVLAKLGPLWLAVLTRAFLAGMGRSDASVREELKNALEDLAEAERDAARLEEELAALERAAEPHGISARPAGR